MYKPTLWFVLDTETSGDQVRKGVNMVHDLAWIAIDRNGREYSRGSYFFPEVFSDKKKLDRKLKLYEKQIDDERVQFANWDTVRTKFNKELAWYRAAGHKVIVAAYNASFDYERLDATEFMLHPDKYKIDHGLLKGVRDESLASYFTPEVDWMDIWMQWAASCPRLYTAPKRTKTHGWFSTAAEWVGKFEIGEDYKHRHFAIDDCEGECEILLRSLARKQKLMINTIFDNNPAEIAHKRVVRADMVAA